jgi:hypothetical protein
MAYRTEIIYRPNRDKRNDFPAPDEGELVEVLEVDGNKLKVLLELPDEDANLDFGE